MVARAGKEVGSWHQTDFVTASRDVGFSGQSRLDS
jgi:hypothetical protein